MRALLPLAALCALSASLCAPRHAHACSGEASLHRRSVQPVDGAEAIPTNTEVRIEYGGTSGIERLASLEDIVVRPAAGGAAVDLTVETRPTTSGTVVVARPAVPLVAGTRYEVLDRLADDWCSVEPCFGEPVVVATFTTGEGEDRQVPAFGGLRGVSSTPDECDSSACCGPYSVVVHAFSWEPATDDGPADQIRYNVYGPGDALVAALVSSARGYETCAGWPTGDDEIGHFATAPGDWSVRAVDLAGNEDRNAAVVRVEPGCAGLDEEPMAADAGVCEAGVEGDSDGAVVDAPLPQASGCAVASGGSRGPDAPGSVALILVAALMLTVRRR